MGLEENKAIARRWTTDIWDRSNVDDALAAVDQIIAPEFVDHALPPGFPEGVEDCVSRCESSTPPSLIFTLR